MQKIRWKKGPLGYFAWALLAAAAAVTFGLCAAEILKELGISDRRALAGLTGVLFLSSLRLFFYIREWVDERRGEEREKRRGPGQKRFKAAFCFFAWLLLAVFLRGIWISFFGDRFKDGLFFYELARIGGNLDFSQLACNDFGLYIRLLNRVFSFTGNRAAAAVWTQAFLQIVLLLLLYGLAGRLWGRAAALWALFLGAVMPVWITGLNALSPDLLDAVCFSAALWAAALLWASMERKKPWKPVFLAALTGILTAGCAWMHLYGAVLFLAVLLCTLTLDGKRRSRRLLSGVLLSVCWGAAFAGLLAWEAWRKGQSLWAAAVSYGEAYVSDVRFALPGAREPEDLIGLFVLCIMAEMAVVGFFAQKWEKSRLTALLLAGAAVLEGLNMTRASFTNCFGAVWILAACAGVQCFADRWEEQPVMEMEKKVFERKKRTEERKETTKAAETEETAQTKETVRLIPNPLPLPKRHERRTMDYDYQPEPENLKFDLELTPGKDEYDI